MINNKKVITYKEVKLFLEEYKEKAYLLCLLLPPLVKNIDKVIKAIDDENEEEFDYNLKKFIEYVEMLNKKVED